MGYATLLWDGSVNGMVSLIDPGSHFASSLQTANDSGKVVMITNLTTKVLGRDITELIIPSNKIVLLPTWGTTPLLMSNEYLLHAKTKVKATLNPSDTQLSLWPKSNAITVHSFIRSTSMRKELPWSMGHDFLATIMNEDGNYSDAMMLSEDRAILR